MVSGGYAARWFALFLAFYLSYGGVVPAGRPPPRLRKFVSPAVDAEIARIKAKMSDPQLAQLFENCLPNTLDTTIFSFTEGSASTVDAVRDTVHDTAAADDTFVITGDIDAMWLRDSMNQVLPYFRFARKDARLQALLRGVVNRQALCVRTDAFANAFNLNRNGNPGPHQDDATTSPSFLGTRVDAMSPAVFERKYELDSLMAFLKLSRTYHTATNDTTPFDAPWLSAVSTVLAIVSAQRDDAQQQFGACLQGNTQCNAQYLFQRQALEPTDSLEHGRGPPFRRTGMSRTPFRPSDDATTLPYLIPANAMAVVELRNIANVLRALPTPACDTISAHGAVSTCPVSPLKLATEAEALAHGLQEGIETHGVVKHSSGSGDVYAYEVDGFGNHYFMDDANVPSLLSLPYLGYVDKSDERYLRTRKAVLSTSGNPYFFSGAAGEGTGGPHIGLNYVWPMGIIVRALTSDDDAEIAHCLTMLRNAANTTGFMHESFWADDAGVFTRPWFAWANSLYGELILTLADSRPHLIFGA